MAYKRHRESGEGHRPRSTTFWYEASNVPGVHRAWSNYPTYSFPHPNHSIMDDVVGESGLYNPIYHFSLSGFLTGIPPVVNPSNGVVYSSDQELSFPMMVNTGEGYHSWPWLPALSAAQLSDYSIEAFNKFHDQVPTEVSLANFMYELKDMKGMIPKLEKSITKTAANNFLAFSFGTAPFVDDVKKIVGMSEAVDKRLKHLISINGRTTDLSFKRNIIYDETFEFVRSLTDPYAFLLGDGDYDRVYFRRQSARLTLIIRGKLSQDLKDLADANAKLKALIAAGGFNHPARVIWNAIPYSFVVDWFFSVGKLLDSLAVQPFGGKYDITDVGYSIKREASFVATYQPPTPDIVQGNPTLGTVGVKCYERFNGFPATSLLLTDGLLTPKQQVLALAMLEQKRR